MTRFESTGPAQTRAFAAELVRSWPADAVIALHGDLGAGKTQFVKGLADGLGFDGDEVTSPTFTIVHEYGDGALIHLDAYRVEHPRELVEFGFEDLIGAGMLAIEWPDRLGELLPPDAIHVRINHEGAERRVITIP